MSSRKWSRVESLLFTLESEARYKRSVLKAGQYSSIEKLTMRDRHSLSAKLIQLESDIISIRGWFKYRKKVPL